MHTYAYMYTQTYMCDTYTYVQTCTQILPLALFLWRTLTDAGDMGKSYMKEKGWPQQGLNKSMWLECRNHGAKSPGKGQWCGLP